LKLQDKHGEEEPENPHTNEKAPSLLLHPPPYLLSKLNIQNLLMDVFPFIRQ
jgi:hypothetical protein